MSQLKRSKHLKIPLKEIIKGTKNFEVCIGNGGYGKVYKGELVISGKTITVAIKRLNEQRGQGLKEFLTEIQLLSGLKHPNLISLRGYCDEEKEKIVVYEYAEHGSLDKYLRCDDAAHTTLTWVQRLKICVGAARGLDYLHNHVGKHQTIIHRDIKSANILIDENWVAKVSDLGLSKLISLKSLNKSDVISHPCGTHGYCEPEYIHTKIVKKQSDVYSFGMVLFEVLCGKLCTIKDNDGFMLSCSSIKKYYEENKINEIIDPRIKGEIDLFSMNKFAAIAYKCLHDEREQRPTTGLLVKELRESLKLQVSQSSGTNFYSETPSTVSSPNSYSKTESQNWSSNSYHQSLHPQFDFEIARLKEKVHSIREPTLTIRKRFMAWGIFNLLDFDKDGALNRRELEAFIHALHPELKVEEMMLPIDVDNFYILYEDYIDGEKGLTLSGFLLTLSFDEVHFRFESEQSRIDRLLIRNVFSALVVLSFSLLIITPSLFNSLEEVLVPTTFEVSGEGSPFLVHIGVWLIECVFSNLELLTTSIIYYILFFAIYLSLFNMYKIS